MRGPFPFVFPLILTLATGLGAQSTQDLFPKLSPYASVSQTIGTSTVTVEYHRPHIKGRKIWGELVPLGQVWRTGANEATVIRFSDNVKVDGHPVPAGTYGLFTIPDQEHWTFILSKRWKQFGAFEYNPKDDVLRFDVKPRTVPFNEWLSFEIYPASRSSAYVDLYWEKLRVSFLVEVDVDAMVMSRMKRAMAKAEPSDWKIYAESAEYLLEQERDVPQALNWVDKSIKIQENPKNLFVKARLQRVAGQAPEAYKTLDKAIKLAESQKAGPVVIGPMKQFLNQWKQANGGNNASGGQR